jgi:hypothetical protein
MKQSGTDDCLDTLQIESASRFAIAENDAKQLLYFAGDFPLNDFRYFFSYADGMASATGRSALRVDLNELLTELLIVAKLRHLALRLIKRPFLCRAPDLTYIRRPELSSCPQTASMPLLNREYV